MTTYTELEDAALRAERARNWLHAADLWRHAEIVAVGYSAAVRCMQAEKECRDRAAEMMAHQGTPLL